MIVVTLIGVLAAIAIPQFIQYQRFRETGFNIDYKLEILFTYFMGENLIHIHKDCMGIHGGIFEFQLSGFHLGEVEDIIN